MHKKRKLRAHAFDMSNERENIEALVQKKLDYLVAEGVVVAFPDPWNGEILYRLKTEEEIEQELQAILAD